MQLNIFSLLILCLLLLYIGYLLGSKQKNKLKKGNINQSYLQGFNFLLNDQSDKALEVFIDALEVDSDTVELHIALGGLFRRQGQIDRATRIHQNIIARPNLNEEHHFQAVHELAKDYVAAGLQDRAEGLFLELIDNHVFLEESYSSLMDIYESQKDWNNALKMANRLDANVHVAKRASHYHYELAEKFFKENKIVKVKQHMEKAKKAFPESSRYGLLSVKLALESYDVEKALSTYTAIVDSSMSVRSMMQSAIVDKLLQNNHSKLNEFLVNEIELRPGIKVLQTFLELNHYSQEVCSTVLESVLNAGRSSLNYWLAGQLVNFPNEISEIVHQKFGAQMLEYDNKESELQKYQCSECGFKSKVLNWCCPSCQVWESQESMLI